MPIRTIYLSAGGLTRCAAIALVTAMTGACALPVSIPLAPLASYAGDGGGAAELVTGSIEPAIEDAGITARLGAEAWPSLRPVLATAITRGDDGETFAWRSPESGFAGTVTPVAAYFSDNGGTCRRLAVTAAQGGTSDVFLAEACRSDRGSWRVAPT